MSLRLEFFLQTADIQTGGERESQRWEITSSQVKSSTSSQVGQPMNKRSPQESQDQKQQ